MYRDRADEINLQPLQFYPPKKKRSRRSKEILSLKPSGPEKYLPLLIDQFTNAERL